MKFFSIAALALVAAAAVSAAPAVAQPNAQVGFVHVRRDSAPGTIQNVGQLVALIEKGLGITSLENQIDSTLGGKLTEIENALGLNQAEKALGLTQGKLPDGVVEKIGNLIKTIDNELGVTTLEDKLNGLLGGTLFELEDKLGLSYLLQQLGIE